MIAITVFLYAPALMIVLFAKYRSHAAAVTVLMLMFFIIIAVVPLTQIKSGDDSMLFWVALFMTIWVLPLLLLSVAPAKAVTRRLIFLALGLLLLVGLNQLSMLGFDITVLKPPS
jgi:hypothetical protein